MTFTGGDRQSNNSDNTEENPSPTVNYDGGEEKEVSQK